jgi:hypothetical protein
LPNLSYFGAVIATEDGHEIYVGLDAANDFVLISNGADNLGVIMLDGLGGLHRANVPPEYLSPPMPPLPYFGNRPDATLDWAVGLIWK